MLRLILLHYSASHCRNIQHTFFCTGSNRPISGHLKSHSSEVTRRYKIRWDKKRKQGVTFLSLSI